MNQQNIRIFMAVVEHGSIASAARVLHYTHPRVSESVRQLESELGVQLLLRGRGIRRVELTPEGQRFIPVAMQWVMADRQIERYIQEEKEPVFRLNISSVLMECMAPVIVKKMRQEIPNLQVRLVSNSNQKVLEMMSRREINAAIWVGMPVKNPELILLPFFNEERCILCPADTPLPDRPIRPEELDSRYEVRYSYVSTTSSVEPAPWRREYFPDRMPPMIRVENYMAAGPMMDDRRCWCIGPEKVVRWSIDRYPGKLTLRRLDPAPPQQKSGILTHKGMQDTPIFRCFLRCCDAYLDGVPYLEKTLVVQSEK